jgi:hypothetical protein
MRPREKGLTRFGLDERNKCSHFVLMSQEGAKELHTLMLLEQLRAESAELWGTSSRLNERINGLLRQLADPRLPDIPTNLPFRVEMWDRADQHIRWVVSASSGVMMAHAAFDVAVANYPDQRFTLRNRALAIRKHEPR